MKILHAADLHLGTPFRGHPDDEIAELKQALLSMPGRLTALCKAHQCQMMLLSGDLFDGQPTAESVQALKSALKEAAVPVFISPGNHDFCSHNSPYLTENWPENVHIFTKPVMESVSLPQLDCRVYGAGYQSMDCGPLLENFRLDGNETYQIGLLHSDPIQPNTPYCPITQPQVAASGLTYLALGHVHKAGSFTTGQTLCAWPGCPMGRGYDEQGQKGLFIVTVDETVSTRFIPVDTPRFYDLDITASGDPVADLNAILPPVGNNDFYRITFTGASEPIDLSALKETFSRFPNLELRDRTTLPVDIWASVGEDSFEGMYFKLLQDALNGQDEEMQRRITLAAEISRKLLDGQEVALP